MRYPSPQSENTWYALHAPLPPLHLTCQFCIFQNNGLKTRHVVLPRPILAGYPDSSPTIPSTLTSGSESSPDITLVDQTPIHASLEVPSGITVRNPRRSSNACLQLAQLSSALDEDSEMSTDVTLSDISSGPGSSTYDSRLAPMVSEIPAMTCKAIGGRSFASSSRLQVQDMPLSEMAHHAPKPTTGAQAWSRSVTSEFARPAQPYPIQVPSF